MRLREKKGTKVPHALSVKLCMRSHGCTNQIKLKRGNILRIDDIKKYSPEKLKKFMDAEGTEVLFHKKKSVSDPKLGTFDKTKFMKLTADETKTFLERYGFDFLDGIDMQC